MKKSDRIFVTGFMGSDRKALAESLSKEYGYELVDLDKEIEEKDGRSIRRICMMGGEHAYRNQEYEWLTILCEKTGIVVLCSDGIVFDDMCLEILETQDVRIADADLSVDELWERAKNDDSIPYAFMLSEDEQEKFKKFKAAYETRRPRYDKFI